MALSRPIHNPACGCSVPAGVRLDPVTMELDLCDFLEDKFGLAGHGAWMQARMCREELRTGSFAEWLESLKGAGIAPALHAELLDAATGVLRGMAEHASGRLAPVGALSAGWLSGADASAFDH
jgi:hypothetical protein